MYSDAFICECAIREVVIKTTRHRKTTLKDIAKEADVSPTTVSLVLKNHDTTRVGAETRKLILEIAKRLNYRPNYAARALLKQESYTLGLVITTLVNPFYSEIAQDIIARCKEIGYSVIISSVRGGIEDERRSVQDLLDRGVDGLIMCSAYRDDPVVFDLIQLGVPFILALRGVRQRVGDPPVDFIVVDNKRGGYIAVKHLLRLGHRRIGIITGDPETVTGKHRLQGSLAAFKANGIVPLQNLIKFGDFQRDCAYCMTGELLQEKDRPTAIFAHSDHMAMGVLERLCKEGIKVPDDMAVVGFDDIEMGRLPGVDLTTVTQKKAIMGRMAVDNLISKIRGESHHLATRVILDPILIIRRSCGFHLEGHRYELPLKKGQEEIVLDGSPNLKGI